MQIRTNKMMRTLLAVLCWLLVVAPASRPAMARDIGEIIASGKLRVAIAEEEFIPWLMRDVAGELIGFEADIARQLAEGLEVKPEFVEIPFSDLIGSLTAGEVDLIVSALSITPERARRVMFSDPYGQSDLELVVLLPNLPEGAEEQSYDMEGMSIAVVAGTTIEVEGRSRFPGSQIVTFADLAMARDAFLAGHVNAIIASKPYPEYLVSRDPETYARIGELADQHRRGSGRRARRSPASELRRFMDCTGDRVRFSGGSYQSLV